MGWAGVGRAAGFQGARTTPGAGRDATGTEAEARGGIHGRRTLFAAPPAKGWDRRPVFVLDILVVDALVADACVPEALAAGAALSRAMPDAGLVTVRRAGATGVGVGVEVGRAAVDFESSGDRSVFEGVALGVSALG